MAFPSPRPTNLSVAQGSGRTRPRASSGGARSARSARSTALGRFCLPCGASWLETSSSRRSRGRT
eukprot:15434399-Alexandrium_andersonii.AAC.1